MSSAEFKEQVTDALRSIWQTAHFWLVYQRSDSRNDLGTNEIRNAAIRLSGSYLDTAVVTLCLLGRSDNKSDLELIFLCFREETERRNFGSAMKESSCPIQSKADEQPADARVRTSAPTPTQMPMFAGLRLGQAYRRVRVPADVDERKRISCDLPMTLSRLSFGLYPPLPARATFQTPELELMKPPVAGKTGHLWRGLPMLPKGARRAYRRTEHSGG